jgi:hypothetical protein
MKYTLVLTLLIGLFIIGVTSAIDFGYNSGSGLSGGSSIVYLNNTASNVNNSDFLNGHNSSYFYPYSNPLAFISNTVSNLVNYYTKTQIDTTLLDYLLISNWNATNTSYALNSSLSNYYLQSNPFGYYNSTTLNSTAYLILNATGLIRDWNASGLIINWSTGAFTETDPVWTSNYTAYNSSWSSTYNATYAGYNSTGLIRDWNNTGLIINWSTGSFVEQDPKAYNGTLALNASLSNYLLISNWNATNTSYALNNSLANYLLISNWNATNLSYATATNLSNYLLITNWNATNTSYYLVTNPNGYYNSTTLNATAYLILNSTGLIKDWNASGWIKNQSTPETDPLWSSNYTAYNSSWSSTYNSTYNGYNSTGLIRDWNISGVLINYSGLGYITKWLVPNTGNGYLYNDSTYIYFNDTKLATAYYNASTVQAIVGTTAGSIEDIQTYNDISYNVSEVNSNPGFDFRVNFTGVSNFNQIILRFNTLNVASESINVQLWDYTTSTWEGYATLTAVTGYNVKTIGVYDNSSHASGGIVQMRFFLNSMGANTHKFEFDWVAIANGFSTPSGAEIDPLSIHKDGTTQLTANWDAGAFNITAQSIFANNICYSNGTNAYTYNSTYAGYNSTGLIRDWNSTGIIKDWNASGFITNQTGGLITWANANNGTLALWSQVMNGTVTNGLMSWSQAVNGTLALASSIPTNNNQLTNGNNYWNNTYATFNKTYADTLYYPLGSNTYGYYNSSTLNSTAYLILNASGLIKDWNATGYIMNWNSTGYIQNWNASGWIKNQTTVETDPKAYNGTLALNSSLSNYVLKAGDSMTGSLNMTTQNITYTGNGKVWSNTTCVIIGGSTSNLFIC